MVILVSVNSRSFQCDQSFYFQTRSVNSKVFSFRRILAEKVSYNAKTKITTANVFLLLNY